MFSGTEVSVLTRACVQAVVSTLLVCVFYHVRTFQPDKWIPSWPFAHANIYFSCSKHASVIFYWIPFICSDTLTLTPQCFHDFHLSQNSKYWTCTSFIRVRITHVSVTFSRPTHRVCPPSWCTVIDELSAGLSAAGTYWERGKDPLALFSVWLPENSSDGQHKHGTGHPNSNPCCHCYCSVKHFPRWSPSRHRRIRTRSDDTTLKVRDKGQTEVKQKMRMNMCPRSMYLDVKSRLTLKTEHTFEESETTTAARFLYSYHCPAE